MQKKGVEKSKENNLYTVYYIRSAELYYTLVIVQILKVYSTVRLFILQYSLYIYSFFKIKNLFYILDRERI